MKKITAILAIVAGMVALASCQKENFVADNSGAAVTIPTHEVVFNANFAKTTLVGTTPNWEEGDSVKILWVEHLPAVDELPERDTVCSSLAAVDAVSGTIKAEVGTPKDYFYAVYPYYATSSIVLGQEGDIDSLQVGIRYSTHLDGTWKSAHYAAAITDEATTTFNFKSVSNVIKFTVSDPTVTSVVINTNDKTILASPQKFTFEGEDPEAVPVLGESSTSEKTTIPVTGVGTYYAPVIYGQNWMAGFTFAEFTAENEMTSFTIAGNPVFATRSELWDFGTLEDHKYVPYDIFATPDGAGSKNGKNWENAVSQADLIDLLGSEVGAYKINNQNLYLSEGTFDLVDVNADKGNLTMAFKKPMTFGIYGGYAATSTGTDLSQRTGKTTLTNASNTISKNARIVYCASGNVNVTFDRLAWAPLAGGTFRGACIYANPGCVGTLVFNDCTLDGASIGNYGAFAQFASCEVTMNRCKFTNNTMNYSDKYSGGVVLCSNFNTTTFNDCEFTGNTSNLPGAAICVESGGVAKINRCLFKDNISNRAASNLKTAGNNRSGAVCLYNYEDANGKYNSYSGNPAPKAYIDSCEFSGNKSTNMAGADISVWGGVADKHIELYINRSYFHDAECSGVSGNISTYFNGKSVNCDAVNGTAGAIVGIYNSTFAETTSPNYSNYSGVFWMNTDFTFANSTIVDKGVASFRNDLRACSTVEQYSCLSCNLINSVISHTGGGNGINCHLDTQIDRLGSSYNIMCKTKNAYTMATWGMDEKYGRVRWIPGTTKPNPVTDGFVQYADMNFTKDAANGIFTFAITAGAESDTDRPVQYTTVKSVADSVAARCPGLDTWLKTIHTDPYSIDKNGNPRNPAKVQKGSWDPYLATE